MRCRSIGCGKSFGCRISIGGASPRNRGARRHDAAGSSAATGVAAGVAGAAGRRARGTAARSSCCRWAKARSGRGRRDPRDSARRSDIIDPAPALLTRGEVTRKSRRSAGWTAGGAGGVAVPGSPVSVGSGSSYSCRAGRPRSRVATGSERHGRRAIHHFRLGDQEYGIPIAAVSEIARPPENITRLPKAPAFIDGVMNLRGSVVPIVDLRRRFDLTVTEQLDPGVFSCWRSAGGPRASSSTACRRS